MNEDGLQLALPARADSVARIRRDVAAYVEGLGLSRGRVGDLKTVVSEACINVVRHAYDEESDGQLEVELAPSGEDLCVVIRDFGCGFCPRPEAEMPSLKMGLPIIGALSTSFRLSSRRDRGTEIEICLPLEVASRPRLSSSCVT